MPVGLINDSWGGSACEAWVRRDILGRREVQTPKWAHIEKTSLDKLLAKGRVEGRPAPRARRGTRACAGQRPARQHLQRRAQATIGYGIRGAIWYQGESNAGRAYQYRDLFPLMIKSWRDEWGQGDFPFYWVQLADFLAEKPEPGKAPGPSCARPRR